MVFLEKKNITKPGHLVQAAKDSGLDHILFEYDYQNKARPLFEKDLLMAREWGVRGFPTIYFIDEEDNRFKVYGSKPYHVYEQALLKLLPTDVYRNISSSYETIFNQYDTVTLKEFAVFHDIDLEAAEAILLGLEQQMKARRTTTNAGSIWKINN